MTLESYDLFALRFRTPRHKSYAWTEERVELFKKLFHSGLAHSQIATELGGITRNASIGKASRLGLHRITTHRTHSTIPGRIKRKRRIRIVNQAYTMPVTEVEYQEPPKPQAFLGLSLMDLTDKTCRFPRGEGADITFCGQPIQEGSKYCIYCHSLCYSPPTVRQKEKYEQRQQMTSRLHLAMRDAPL